MDNRWPQYTWAENWVGGCAPFRGELGPHLTQCRLGRGVPPYQVASWSIQPFDHNRHGPKIGKAMPPFFGGGLKLGWLCSFLGWVGPHLTQSRQGRGLPPYQVASYSIQPFGHNGYGPKIGGCAPFLGELGPHLTQNRLTTVHQRHRQTNRQTRQTGQTDSTTVP